MWLNGVIFHCRSTNINSTGSDSRENDLLEKLKQLSKDSKTSGFDTQRFTELLKEYTEGKINAFSFSIIWTMYHLASNTSNTNTLVTDKLVQILYNFLAENRDHGKSAPANTLPSVDKRAKVVKQECVDAPNILGKIILHFHNELQTQILLFSKWFSGNCTT